jgi:hypothetical protein
LNISEKTGQLKDSIIRKSMISLEKTKEEQLSTPAKHLVERLTQGKQLDLEFAEFGTTFRPIAQLYERMRYLLNYQEQHLLRRQALERILRRYLSSKNEPAKIAEFIAQELVWAKYIISNEVPQRVLNSVSNSICKYRCLLSAVPPANWNKYAQWLLGLCATEIEEKFFPNRARSGVAELLTEVMNKRLQCPEKEEVGDWETQLYIAAQRALNRADSAAIQYHLIVRTLPQFPEASPVIIQRLTERLPELYEKLNLSLKNKLNQKLANHIQKYIPPYIILRDFLETEKDAAGENLAKRTYFSAQVRILSSERYRQTGKRLRAGAIRSILYVFLTKVVLALAIELPFDQYFQHSLQLFQMGVNILFPPILMFAITLFLHTPSETNTDKILHSLHEILFVEPENAPPIHLKKKKTPKTLILVFTLIYLVAFVASFGLLSALLWNLHFSVLSGLIFVFILCLVSFFGFRLRNTARELMMQKERPSLFSTIVDFFALPFLKAGHFLTIKFQKINILLFFLDYVLEAPLKTIISVLEQWTGFVREKKDEIQNLNT